jgi:alpha-1,3/alpha-1,6-mannosyltransferase
VKEDLGVLHPATKFEIGKSPPNLTQSGTFLSINRYERKKNIGLAIRALASLRDDIMGEKEFINQKVHLVIAGGYDERVNENVEHYKELVSMVKSHNLSQHVTFIRSFTDEEKTSLLRDCVAVLYVLDTRSIRS